MINTKELYHFIEKQWQDSIIPSLSEYIKIPNKSPHFDEQWQEHGYMEQAVIHVADWCKTNAPKNMALEVIQLEGRTPLIFIEVPGEGDETTLLYGHLDKQPEMSGWDDDLDPWQPVIKDGKLYGRGAADDGYAVYSTLTAINALQIQEIPHNRCVIIIEACEESGSYDLPYYIDVLKDRIGKPGLIVCLDSGAGNYEQLWMTTSLRGNVVGELSVELIHEGVHSGNASGIVPDSFRVARELLSRVENQITGEILLEKLFCSIPPERINQAADCAATLQDHVYDVFPFYDGVEPVSSNLQELILNRTWRPALTIIGAEGLPALANAGNVMRSNTTFKLSMRLPPLIDANQAAEILEHSLTNLPPYNARVSFKIIDAATGWHAPLVADWLEKAVDEASMTFYNRKTMYMGEGGTIPFMAMLGKSYPDTQFMITGVLGPHSNAHGPNEFLHLDMVKKLTASVALVLNKHYESS